MKHSPAHVKEKATSIQNEFVSSGELKPWKAPQKTSVHLSMTQGKDIQWNAEGFAAGFTWGAS